LTASGGAGGTIFWQNTTNNGTSATTASTSQTVTANGTYFFRARSAAGCWGPQGSSGEIIIVQPHTLVLTSAPATANQTVGQNSAITQIAYTRGGSATAVTVTWTGTANATTAPAGIVVSSLTGNPITITGTPTAAGVFGFSIATVATATCPASDTLTGTIMVTAVIPGCNNFTPVWGAVPLGAGFASATTWIVPGAGGRTSQEWSDAVTATACANKTTFVGGNQNNWNADCRNSVGNANFTGHYFSWCAVMRFAGQLCPAPWRVPTMQDFIDLDLNLGGTGVSRSVEDPAIFGYMGTTAANSPQSIWGGARWTGTVSGNLTGAHSVYWTSSSPMANFAHVLFLGPNTVNPDGHSFSMGDGLALRCVRDAPVCADPNFTFTVHGAGWTTPQSRVEGDCGLFPTFTVLTTAAAGATFQWFYNTVNSTTAGTPTAIVGATASTFIPLRNTVGTRFYFAVVAFPGCGTRTTQVSAAHTVTPLGNINLAAAGCNGTGGIFSTGPGLVTFGNATNTNRDIGATTISGNGINQVWSAHVLASNCNKTAFAGGASPNFHSDCRRSHATNRFYTDPGGRPTGDFFTWCAVVRFRDQFCPYPWRVPTCADFVDLVMALGGSQFGGGDPVVYNRIIASFGVPGQFWRGAHGGFSLGSSGVLSSQGNVGFYWSQTDRVPNGGSMGITGSSNSVSPQNVSSKGDGFALRCVRN